MILIIAIGIILILVCIYLYIFVIRTFLACFFFKSKYPNDVILKFNVFNGIIGYHKNSLKANQDSLKFMRDLAN